MQTQGGYKMRDPVEDFKIDTSKGETYSIDTDEEKRNFKEIYAKTKDHQGKEVYDAEHALKTYCMPPKINDEAGVKMSEAIRNVASSIDADGNVTDAQKLLEGTESAIDAGTIYRAGLEEYEQAVLYQDAQNRYLAHQVIESQNGKIGSLENDVQRLETEKEAAELQKREAEAEARRLGQELAKRPALNARSLKEKLDAELEEINKKLQKKHKA